MSESVQPAADTVTGAAAPEAPPAIPPQTIEEVEAHKKSLIAEVEAELGAIPHELIAKAKAAFAALKAHL